MMNKLDKTPDGPLIKNKSSKAIPGKIVTPTESEGPSKTAVDKTLSKKNKKRISTVADFEDLPEDEAPLGKYLGINHATLYYGYCDSKLENFGIVDTFKIKNSWGSGWGENGKMRLEKTAGDGICEAQKYVWVDEPAEWTSKISKVPRPLLSG